MELAEKEGICIAVSEKILRKAQDDDYDKIIQKLSQKSNARGVIMFADEDETRWVSAIDSLFLACAITNNPSCDSEGRGAIVNDP